MRSDIWNPWHGCVKYSEGCAHCYVYRRDASIGKDASMVAKTKSFDLPLQKRKNGEYKILPGSTIFACMTSDFFLDKADAWRPEAWDMMRQRRDVKFFIITKRILRFYDCIPSDWGQGYSNVFLVCTMENQRQCDLRFPFFKAVPAAKKFVACEPLLTDIDMSRYLDRSISQVIVGGESGSGARLCDYAWILHIRQQCEQKGVAFHFKQTGARFKKGNRVYQIARKYQHQQAKKANIDLL